MRRAWLLLLGLTVLLAAAMALTIPTRLGFGLVEYNVTFAALTLAAGLGWTLLRRRRIATLAMALTGALATGTGFAMLYTRDFPFKEWITWWHSVTSFALVLAFLFHWLHNQPRLWEFAKRLIARERTVGLALSLGWLSLLAFGLWTWSGAIAPSFTRENYLALASWAVLAGVIVWYGPWLAYRARPLRARLRDVAHRNRVRAAIDVSLFLAHWGALLTGFALLYFAEPLRAGPLKYVSKWWHTATSALFLALVALHVGFNARLLAAHARRLDADLQGKPL